MILSSFLFLLQTNVPIDTTGMEDAGKEANDSLLETLIDGGWPMIPLVILLILAIFIYIERYLTIRKANTDSEEFMKQVRRHVLAGNIEAAKGLCESRTTPSLA